MSQLLVGHRRVFDALYPDLPPPVTLLIGPEGVGKDVVAQVVAGAHGYPEWDTLHDKGPLALAGVQAAQAFSQTMAATKRGKLVILGLDSAPAAAQNALLKLLEEPPPGIKFILTASQPPLPTIVSRAMTLRCGLLTSEQVYQVLAAKRIDPAKAQAAAEMAAGRVSVALRLLSVASLVKTSVIDSLKAVAAGRPMAATLPVRTSAWGQENHDLLVAWASEAVTGRWQVFSPSDVPGLDQEQASYALRMLTELDAARPRILDKAVLENLAARHPGRHRA